MDGEVVKLLAEFGPWGLGAGIVLLLRREIAAVLTAPKDDRAVERLLISMNEQFIGNMKLFVETNAKLEAVLLVLTEILAVARDVHTEQVRRK